jgi:NADH-quinone oxidoreductase subunit E/NADP-reducing hydrogenase subunit HndA
METNEAPPVSEENDVEEEEIDLAPTLEIIAKLPKKERRYLIPTLQKIQDVYRYLPEPAVKALMKALRVTRAEIYGIISFYPQLRITEPGKYIIKLCYGTACFVKGAEIIANKIDESYHMKAGETDPTKLFTMQLASCLGNCGAAPMAIVGDDTHGTIDPEKTLDLLSAYKLEDDEPVAEVEESVTE